MMMNDWTEEARKRQGLYAWLQDGPDGIWSAMVISNVKGPAPHDPDVVVHKITVLFSNSGKVTVQTLIRLQTARPIVIIDT